MISVFDLFKIGIGPSSSHTVGPMKAARLFLEELEKLGLDKTSSVHVRLYGSIALTGKGHGTDKALILGLSGELPEEVDPEKIESFVKTVSENKKIFLFGKHEINFDPAKNLEFLRMETLPLHPNGLKFNAIIDGKEFSRNYYSIGGGFVLDEEKSKNPIAVNSSIQQIPYQFRSAADLLEIGNKNKLKISDIMFANEKVFLSEEEIRTRLRKIWAAMQLSIERGYKNKGTLPGGLKVKRRAPQIHSELVARSEGSLKDPLTILDWVNLYAISVNEENASYGRIVTAPTNGAAGIIPAVLNYYVRFYPGSNDEGVIRFLLTAAAIGILYKENASISGAEVGCQGEVGVACSMAAAALTEVMGGTIEQVENAAEIAMEHNLGLTCDPIGGLVQIPCIERNAMASIKAINASRMALRGDGVHYVSLDKVIETMQQTGADMSLKYKETSRGGLAVNIPEC